ncbi:MAG: ImmA/IrrE family metallo-endopeptidase [Clostridia bacterium]|nr:ImmA/IrrE family metallo-endopeptidase [Clostridia bacterium]
MINYDGISERVASIRKKYGERDLFRLCERMGITVILHDTPLSVSDFKGFSIIRSRIPIILLNSKMKEELMDTLLAHEIGHSVLHRELAALRGFHDFDLFGMKDQCEYEANVFAAELLLDNDEVMDVLNQDVTFFGAAKLLRVPPELLDFKFRVLKHQGCAVKPPMLDSGGFLKRVKDGRG